MSRIRTPEHLARFIARHQLDAALITDIGDTPTVPAAARALGVDDRTMLRIAVPDLQRLLAPILLPLRA